MTETKTQPEEKNAKAEPNLPMHDSTLEKARTIIRTNAAWAFAGGIIPLPLVDVLAVSVVQLKMLNELSELYGVPFSDNVAKNLISALLGSLIPSGLTHGTVGYLLRSVPLVGPALGALTMPSFASAATWAIGRVFVQHFESGGTFLDFDPIKVREYFRSEFARAQDEMKGKPGVSR